MIIYDDMHRIPLFKPYFEASGVYHLNHYRSKAMLVLSRFRIRRIIPYSWMYSDPFCAPGDDLIIVFDTHTGPTYLNWLCSRHPDKRVILWFWNPVQRLERFEHLNPRVERWTYSEPDARKYGMRLNTQFYFDCLSKEAESFRRAPSPSFRKALFIGREKGREAWLLELKDELESAGVAADFRVFYPPRATNFQSLREKLIPYREVVDAVKESQVLIDLYADPGAGLSLRAMEALFFGKKLITNRSLMRNEPFYHRHNIYITGEESIPLADFLDLPYAAPDPGIRDSYLLSNWLKRFAGKEAGA
jgi:hypothetical protein